MWLTCGRSKVGNVLNCSAFFRACVSTTAGNGKRCLYDILGVPRTAGSSDIKLAFKQVRQPLEALTYAVDRRLKVVLYRPYPTAEGQGIAPRCRPWHQSRSSREFPESGSCLRNPQ